MAFDFGFANSLMAKDDLAQRRADDQYNLSVASALRQNQQNIADKNQAALSAIQDYYNTTNNETGTLLSQDAAKVNAGEKALRQPVIDELGKYGNDPDMFILNGGKSVLDKYHNDFSNLSALKTGLQNKATAIQAVTDLGAGKIARMVTPSNNGVPLTNADGTPLRVDVPTAWGMFNRGEVDKLPYEGGYAPPEINAQKYLSIPDPYKGKTGGYVPLNELQQDLILHGGPKGTGMNPSDVQDFITTHQGLLVNPKNPQLSTLQFGVNKPQPQPDYRKTKAAFDALHGPGSASDKTLPTSVDVGNDILHNKGSDVNIAIHGWRGIPDGNYTSFPKVKGPEVNTSIDTNGKPIKNIVNSILKDKDGNLYITYANDNHQAHKINDLYSGYYLPVAVARGGNYEEILKKQYDHAKDLGVAEKLGFPSTGIMSAPGAQNPNAGNEGSTEEVPAPEESEYSNISETTDGRSIGVKNGAWYNTKTGEEIK